VDVRFDAVLTQMAPLSQQKCCPSAQSLDGSDRWHDSNRAASSVSQSLVLLAWLHVYQPNKLAWGGARDGGKREAAVS
jgi:hypothetical protein